MADHNTEVTRNQTKTYFSKIGFAYFLGTLITFAAQYLAAIAADTLTPGWMENDTVWLMVSMLPMYIAGLPLMILVITRVKTVSRVERHKLSANNMAVALLMCWTCIHVGSFIGTYLTTVIGQFIGSGVTDVIADMVSGPERWLTFFVTVLCAPVFEEIIFRKLLIDRVIKYGEGLSILLSGLAFGLFHGNLNQFFYAFLVGSFFAFLYVKTGQLKYPVILHMAVNFFGSIVAPWITETAAVIPSAIYLILSNGAAIAGALLFLIYRKKFRVKPGVISIPKGKRFSTVILNPGMLLFCILWLIIIVYQLFS